VATNSSIYGIFSAVRSDRPFGLSPGGLTPGYFGHTFWDQVRASATHCPPQEPATM
jgi:trehalose/maltose hydrolase-like predicted phosphorylase